MRSRRLLAIAALALLGALAAGCAAREGTVVPLASWPIERPTANRKILLLVVRGTTESNVWSAVGESVTDRFRREAVAAYRESGLFDDVRTGADTGDLVLRISIAQAFRFEETGGPTMRVARCIMTGLLVCWSPPGYWRAYVTAQTAIHDAAGAIVGTIAKTETVRGGRLFPWLRSSVPGGSVMSSAVRDVNRATIIDAHARGWL